MTLEKAIEILDVHQKMLRLENMSDLRDAVKLGIEAMKDKLHARHYGHALSEALLPGETK